VEDVDIPENEIDMEYEQLMELGAEQGPGTDEGVPRPTETSIQAMETFILVLAISANKYCKSSAPDLWKIPVRSPQFTTISAHYSLTRSSPSCKRLLDGT